MPVSDTLAAIGRFIRRPPLPPADLLEAYAHEVIPVLDRAEWLYQYWLEQSTLFTDSEKLGNVAAIHRWETATMGRSLERVIPPSVLAGAHDRVIDALEMASRAAQLLSNGSRFHNANAVCEGQSMLSASRERRLSALKSMRRYLVTVVQPAPTSVEPEALAADTIPAGAMVDLTIPTPEAVPSGSGEPELAVAGVTPGDERHPLSVEATEHDPLLDVESLPPAPLADPDVPPPSFLRSDPDSESSRASAMVAESVPEQETAQSVAANEAVAPTVRPPENAASTPDDEMPAPPAESRPRSNWGSLFGRPPDQPPA